MGGKGFNHKLKTFQLWCVCVLKCYCVNIQWCHNCHCCSH